MSDRREGLTYGIDLGKASIGFAVVDFINALMETVQE